MANADQPKISTLNEALTLRTVDQLKKLLDLLPVQAKGTRKAELMDAIATYLLGSGLKKLWKDLDDLQQAAVAEAVHVTNGLYQGEQFRAKYGDVPEWSTRANPYRYHQPVAKLDLFFYPQSNYSYVGAILPEDLRLKLDAFVPKPEAVTLETANEPPKTFTVEYHTYDYELRKSLKTVEEVPVVCDLREQAAQQDLLAVLRLVHLGKVSVSDKTLMPGKAALKAIAPLLQGGDYYSEADQPKEDYHDPIGDIKPFAWMMLLQAGKLASLEGKKLQLTKAGQKAMSAAPAATIKAIWKKWLKTTVLDELRRIDSIKGQTGKGKRGLTALSGRRTQIAEALKQCPVGQWVEYDQLRRNMIVNGQTFEVSHSPDNLYICEAGYGNLYEASRTWSILQDGYMKCLLFEYAATLGLLDIAYVTPHNGPSYDLREYWGADDLSFLSRYDGLLSFRLTPMGAFCLDLAAGYTPVVPTRTEGSLRVLPNLDIVMTGAPLSPAENLMMETFTQQTGDAVWQLDREMVLKAAEAGHSLEEFQNFLAKASEGGFPKTVEQFFTDCRRRTESLKDQGIARLIQCVDAPLATLIANDSRTKKYCQLAGEKSLVVPLDQETRFRNGLRKLGYTLPLSAN